MIDGSPQTEVLAGRAQSIRSDDYVAVLPQILSQRAHAPAFPKINRLIGGGACNMAMNFAMPIRDWTALFRPTMWGYFAGADFGLAWHWWVQTLGAWLALFLVITLITDGRAGLAAGGATVLLFSPFFQYWSQNAGPSVAYPLAMVLCAASLYRAGSRFGLAFSALGVTAFLLAWWLTFSFFPYLVTMAYLVLALFLGLWPPGTTDPAGASARTRTFLLLAAGVAAVLLGALFVAQNLEAIRVAASSVYPGRRVAAGGEESWLELFRGWFLAWIYPEQWHGFGHLRRATCFCLFFPLTLVLLGLRWRRQGRRPERIQVALLAVLALFITWYVVGLPAWLARGTGLARVPGPRALLVIGLADLFLLVTALRHHLATPWRQNARESAVWAAWLGWALLLVAEGLALHAVLPALGSRAYILAGAITWGLGGLLLFQPRPFLPLLALASVLATGPFNPLVKGGTAFIRDNPLSRAILDITAQAQAQGRDPVWLAYGSERYDIHLPNLFRMLGVRSLDGVHPYPQPELWRILDPDRAFEPVWNRYAHVRLVLPKSPEDTAIQLLQPDLIAVRLHPQHPRFAAAGVTHLLVRGDPAPWDAIPTLRRIWSGGDKHIYELGLNVQH